MSIVQQTVCDGPQCKVIRQESNHWYWLMRPNMGGLWFGFSDNRPIDPVSICDTPIFDLCGQNCLIAKINELINPGKAEVGR